MNHVVRPALRLLLFSTLILGIAYPLLVTLCGQALFPEQAQGSLLKEKDILRGSALIGQPFTQGSYFWGRPSASSPQPYNAASSAASNLGPRNPALRAAVLERVRSLREAHPQSNSAIPVDLVTSSASGLDPHISISAALYQAPRVAKARGLSLEMVLRLIETLAVREILHYPEEPYLNVLLLNLALDRITSEPGS